ncbi:MAG: DNA polymerase, partial [Phycisphaerales bacterium]
VTRLTAERPDLRIRIVSKDKDLKQLLVQGRVELYDIHTDAIIDQATLKGETGIDPPQVADMLALMGDSSDNIPGVEGIGPKTAAELIARFGTAQAVLEAARASASMGKDAPIKGARAEKIRAAADILAISRQLVELRRDVPITLDLASAAQSSFRLDSLMPLLRELGFNRYQDELRSLLGSNTSSGSVSSAAGLESVRQTTSPTFAPRSSPSAVSARARPVASDSPAGTLFASLDESSGAQDGMSQISSRAAGAATRGTYRCARSEADYAELAAELAGAKVISLDTETTGLSPMRSELVGVSISTRAGAGWYLPCRSPEPATHATPDALAAFLRANIAGSSTPIVGHNLKFDLLVLRRAGVEIANFDSRAFDTLIASFLIDSGRSSHSLDALALSLLGHTNISIKELLGSGASQKTFDAVPLELATEYAAEDADVALRLHDLFAPQLRAMELDTLFRDVELPLVAVLADLEFNGVLLDTAELERQRARLVNRMAELKAELDDQTHAALGRTINPDSPKQLAAALFNAPTDAEPGLGIKPVKKTKTGFSTDIEVLETLSEDASITTPIPRLIADHRQLAKLVGTYLESLRDEVNPRTGRIHASFNQTVAVTGRLSSSDPNLQNIPIRTEDGRKIREAFIAPPGRKILSFDYSQIELRIMAHLSDDAGLLAAFGSGQDVH